MIDFDTIVLCGGSGKGLTILGSLQYVTEHKNWDKIKTFIGTSSGAIICFLLSIGYTPVEIIIYLCTHRLFEKVLHFNILNMINGNGAISFSVYQEILEKMTIAKIGHLPRMEEIYNKYGHMLIFATYNLTEQKVEYLSHENYPDLPCLTALRMSCNLPLIFEKYNYNNCFYVDGGLVDNFPIDIADKLGKKSLGITIENKLEKNVTEYKNIIEYIYTLLSIPSAKYLDEKIKNKTNSCVVVKLECDEISNFNFNIDNIKKLDLFSSGYNQIRDKLEQNIIKNTQIKSEEKITDKPEIKDHKIDHKIDDKIDDKENTSEAHIKTELH